MNSGIFYQTMYPVTIKTFLFGISFNIFYS